MATNTSIQWTDATWNPTRGCSRVSPGCTNCYAERMARRLSGKGGSYEGLLHKTGAWNGGITLVEGALEQPERWRKPRRVFVDSMSDLFHESVPFDFVDKVFETMITNERHTFQILTKRPERMFEYMTSSDTWPRRVTMDKLPPSNVWLGVSAENQETADARIPILLRTPAAIHFVSFEPLLGPIKSNRLHFHCPTHDFAGGFCLGGTCPDLQQPDWIIVGGESGPRARACALGWIKDIVRQHQKTGCAVFVKQLGAKPTNREGEPCPHIHARKGDDMGEWPEELKVREWPKVLTP